MKHLVRFPLETGGSVIIEVEDQGADLGGDTLRGINPPGGNQALTDASQSLDSALDGIKPAAESILTKLTSLSKRPDEVDVTFGLKISAKFGVVIASGDIEANFTVSLKWKNDPSAPPNPPSLSRNRF